MRPETLKSTLKALFAKQRTVCIEGSPGGGKTSIVRQLAEGLDVPYIERHLPTALPEDFGIPFPNHSEERFEMKLPDWFPVKGHAPEKGILCIDDRNQANPDLQKILANICQARNLHGHELPPGWMVISTGNRQQDRAGANKILSHLRDRETVLTLDTHLDDWTAWAIDNGVPAEGRSFLNFRPNLLHDFDPHKDVSPTPRSWVEGVFALLGKVPHDAEYEVFAGSVGEGAAAEFTGFLRIFRKLPDPKAVLNDPDAAVVPDDSATLYALTGALAEYVNKDTLKNMVKYLERVPKEFSVLGMSTAIRRDNSLCNAEGFVEWSSSHQNVIF